MALTRITSNVIKNNTIEEGKFDKTYLDSTNAIYFGFSLYFIYYVAKPRIVITSPI